MAEVWLARARGIGGFQKTVVLKTILPHFADNPEFVTMFVNEALTASVLNHPNIVQIFDLGEEDSRHYIAMEFIHGRTLRQVQRTLARVKRVPHPWLVLHTAMAVCDALQYAHSMTDDEGEPLNIVHRDVTPENIMLAFTGVTKVLDFGIAKASFVATNTQVGTLKGKYSYMAPERLLTMQEGEQSDQRSDIYSLGVLLYEVLTGIRPFKASNELTLFKKITEGKAEPPHTLARWVTEPLSVIVMKAMAREPHERYQTALDLREAIQSFLNAVPSHPTERHVADYLGILFPDSKLARPVTQIHPARRKAATTKQKRARSTGPHPPPVPAEVEPKRSDDDDVPGLTDQESGSYPSAEGSRIRPPLESSSPKSPNVITGVNQVTGPGRPEPNVTVPIGEPEDEPSVADVVELVAMAADEETGSDGPDALVAETARGTGPHALVAVEEADEKSTKDAAKDLDGLVVDLTGVNQVPPAEEPASAMQPATPGTAKVGSDEARGVRDPASPATHELFDLADMSSIEVTPVGRTLADEGAPDLSEINEGWGDGPHAADVEVPQNDRSAHDNPTREVTPIDVEQESSTREVESVATAHDAPTRELPAIDAVATAAAADEEPSAEAAADDRASGDTESPKLSAWDRAVTASVAVPVTASPDPGSPADERGESADERSESVAEPDESAAESDGSAAVAGQPPEGEPERATDDEVEPEEQVSIWERHAQQKVREATRVAWDRVVQNVRRERSDESGEVAAASEEPAPAPVEPSALDHDAGAGMEPEEQTTLSGWDAVIEARRAARRAALLQAEASAEPMTAPLSPEEEARQLSELAFSRKQAEDYEGALSAWRRAAELDPETKGYANNAKRIEELIERRKRS